MLIFLVNIVIFVKKLMQHKYMSSQKQVRASLQFRAIMYMRYIRIILYVINLLQSIISHRGLLVQAVLCQKQSIPRSTRIKSVRTDPIDPATSAALKVQWTACCTTLTVSQENVPQSCAKTFRYNLFSMSSRNTILVEKYQAIET